MVFIQRTLQGAWRCIRKAYISRDNLDENGQRRSECEAAAGSDIIIVSDFAVRKRVLRDARRVWSGVRKAEELAQDS
jgi:hypothetical protein